jgi:hypothetical protein
MKHPKSSDRAVFSGAVERVQPQLDAIPPEELEPVRHDIVDATVTVLGVASHAKQYRGEVKAQIGESAAQHLDVLEDAARACGHAHATYLSQVHGIDTDGAAEGTSRSRRILLAEARSLVGQKKMPASVLGEIVGGTGQKALCLDVLQLVAAFRTSWASVSDQTSVTIDELDQAEALANALATSLGENEQGNASSPAAELRLRAYTFFVRTYDEVRRAIHFVRWDAGDADEIAPSLGAGRTRHAADEEPAPSTTPAAPAAPTPVAAPAPVGTPGAQPFVTSS